MEQYSALSEIYDRMIDMDYDRWMKFLKDFTALKGLKMRGLKTLELACGTGNMTLRLKASGADITAIDISPEMLSIAEEKLREKRYNVRFINQNIEDFNAGKDYGIVFSFCDGYNYILSDKVIEESFKRVFTHLSAGGYFIFDISTLWKLENILGNNTFTSVEDDCCYIWENSYAEKSVEMYLTFFVKSGKDYKRFDEIHYQRAYTVQEIKNLLAAAGFTEIEVYEDYSFENIKEDSLRAVFIAKKAEV